ncbi:LuxR C-terminal-related transcriptional regulator [Mycobacterium sp. IDR2000157661]|nr:LuxR C-terminal-related transcriptional regulator [Mycobacterium sp. IDR2000157661]
MVVGALLREIQARKNLPDAALAPLYEAVIELQRCGSEIAQQRADDRIRILSAARGADAYLGSDLDVSTLLERSAAAACRACDLDRAMIFMLRDGHLHAAATYFAGHDDWAADCHAHAVQTPIDLSAGRLETEMIRRQLPALMTDTMNDPQAFAPIVQRIQTQSYVAVPIVVDGAVVGSLHLDAYYRQRDVDSVDRDAAAVFARSIGHALERALAAEQLAAQRAALCDLVRQTDTSLRLLRGGQSARPPLRHGLPHPQPAPHLAPAREVAPARAMTSAAAGAPASLTRREIEVLRLMSTGATNAEIAARFIVAEGTVKTHVKRILRKLNVTNRGQAVAIYAGLAAPR